MVASTRAKSPASSGPPGARREPGGGELCLDALAAELGAHLDPELFRGSKRKLDLEFVDAHSVRL
jgi:hypothetical protein